MTRLLGPPERLSSGPTEVPMLNPAYQVERPAAAGRPRAFACGVVVAGIDGAMDRGWATTPSAKPVSVGHDLTPAPRPEEAVPR